MTEYIVKKVAGKNEANEDCMIAEIQFDREVLRNNAKHCKHFFVEYETEEDLQQILSEFEFKSEVK